MYMVPEAGVEPARGYPRGILSPLRLQNTELYRIIQKHTGTKKPARVPVLVGFRFIQEHLETL